MKREEKKWRPYAGTSSYRNYVNSAFLFLYSSIPILHFLMYPTILCTGGPGFSCEMIILHNDSHSGIIRVCMRMCTTALRNKTIRQILNKNTSPYFHSVSLVIWPLFLMKSTHLSELSISRFSTYIRKAKMGSFHQSKRSGNKWYAV